jgi:beta-galactosidase
MRKYLLLFIAVASVFTTFKARAAKESKVREVINIDKQWKFHEGELSGAYLPEFQDANWAKVDVPHDWRIHDKYGKENEKRAGNLPTGIGWYRKIIDIKPAYQGKKIYVSFDGVFDNYTVWVNGKKAGYHYSGYTGCVLDITDLVNFHSSKNILAVLVDDKDSSDFAKSYHIKGGSEFGPGKEGWWYEGYGIYRHVNLIVTNPVHVATWGTFVYTDNDSYQSANVNMRVNIANETNHACNFTVKNLLLDPAGKQAGIVSDKYAIEVNGQINIQQKAKVLNPKLWSPDHPNLYTVVTKVYVDGALKDEYQTPFGIRWFKFTADSGFYLNGKHLQLRGINIHAGFGGLGTALPDRANDYDVELAKQMGCNIIRSAHHDPSPSLMNACDRLGMLLWAETRYLGRDSTSTSALHDMIVRDRNHPSIICWSLANNSGRNDTVLTNTLKTLNAVVKQADTTRPTVFGCEANGDPNKSGFAFVTDVMGYNGGGMGRDDKDHKNYPDRKMLISEFSSGTGARGVYKEERVGVDEKETWGDGRTVHNGYIYSIYDLCTATEEEWTHIATRPWLAGGIMWSGIEYLGETSGWPVVTSQFGVFDVARFKKDTYYYLLQEWTKKPIVYIFPHWTWGKKDSVINVWCYSNCDRVELFLNGKSLGIKPKMVHGHIEWKVPYQPGTLSVKGYDATGKQLAQYAVETASTAYQLIAEADRKTIRAAGNDLSFITIKVCDKKGTMLPNASNLINVEVKGGKLLGLCSGSPVSHADPATPIMKAFNGMLLAIVQSNGSPGKISVNITSKGLKPCSLDIKANQD